jgi:transcriptional regulator with XRE-family HTH domain
LTTRQPLVMILSMKKVTTTNELRQIVRESGLSLNELARATGVHKSQWSRFLSGERGITEGHLDKLGELFHLKIVAGGKRPSAKKGG